MESQASEISRFLRSLGITARSKRKSAIANFFLRRLAFSSFIKNKHRKKLQKSALKGALADLKYVAEKIAVDEARTTSIAADEVRTGNEAGIRPHADTVLASWRATRLITVGPRSNFDEERRGSEILGHPGDRALQLDVCPPAPIFRRFSALPEGFLEAKSRPEWLRENRAAVVQSLGNAFAGMRVLSLDVFDTFLLRGTEAEAERFHLLSEYILDKLSREAVGIPLRRHSAESLTLLRARAMQLTYSFRPRRDGCGEGSINEVARNIAHTIGGNDQLADRLVALELSFEASMLRKNEPLSCTMKRFKEDGGTVILISDMYLHSEQIRQICAEVDPDGMGCVDAIYSSADTLYSKRAGLVYTLVAEEQKLQGRTTVHVGDSYVSDVERARQAGWNAVHFPISRYEQVARGKSLANLIARYDAVGIDIRDWAKV